MAFKTCDRYFHGSDASLKLDLSFMDAPNTNTTEASRPSSALARGVRVTEVSGKVNPEPAAADETEFLIEEFLSPRKLRALTGLDNLEDVHFLEMKVDTSETSLGNFGMLLPNLSQLKLSNSIIASIRDLGSSFSALRILWMARCGLHDLDGVSAMCCLRELYLAYNEVTDVSPVSMLDQLDILDLEGNNIDDLSQIEFLSLCTSLRCLTIEGNPVCLTPHPSQAARDYDYRYAVKKAVPSLQVLDDVPLVLAASGKLVYGGSTSSFDADWNFLLELEKDGTMVTQAEAAELDALSRGGSSATRPVTSYRPGTAMRPTSAMKRIGTAARPTTTARLGTAATSRARGSLSPGFDGGAAQNDASALTQGGVVCGNPSRALKTRQGKRLAAGTIAGLPDASAMHPTSFSQFKHVAEHTYDKLLVDEESPDLLFEELKQWRIKHEQLHKKIEASRAPQVLKINHAEQILEDDECDVPVDVCYQMGHDDAMYERVGGGGGDDAFLPAELDSGFRSRSEVTATPDEGDNFSSPSSSIDSSQVSSAAITRLPTPPEKVKGSNGRRMTRTRSSADSDKRKSDVDETSTAAPSDFASEPETIADHVLIRDYADGGNRPNSGPAPVGREKFRLEPNVDKSRPKYIDSENPIVRLELKSPEKPVLDRSSKTAKAAVPMLLQMTKMKRQLPLATSLPPKPALQK